MNRLTKAFFIALASLTLVGVSGCAKTQTSSSSKQDTALSSHSASYKSEHRSTATTMALATYNLMQSNGQLSRLNDDIEPVAYNVVEDTTNNKITFTAGVEQNDYFQRSADITITNNSVTYSSRESKASINTLYKKYFRTQKFHEFLDEFEIEDED